MILAMCQQHPRQIQRQRHTQRQIQRQRQERTFKKKSSCICIAYKLHIIYHRIKKDLPPPPQKIFPLSGISRNSVNGSDMPRALSLVSTQIPLIKLNLSFA